jgi:Secretion system C-terminal sorting domain
LADGDNLYNISNNTFYNSYAGSILYSNGENETGHFQNQINTIVGVHSLNQNKGYQFMDNCFSSTGGDVYIDGEIMSQVGDETREAGNCFTKQNIPDINATGTSFEYFRPDIKINTCSDPITQSGYVEKNGFQNPDLACGSGVPYTGPVYNYCNFNIKTLSCAQAKILANQLLTQINFIKNSNTYNNATQKAYLLRRLGICRTRLLKFMFGCQDPIPDDPKGDGDGSFNYPSDGIAAGNDLMNSTNKYESAAFVGLSIELGMLSEASNYLASMPYTDEEMVDFRDVQLINIDYQIQKDSFVLSPADQNVLYTVGQKSDPLAAYARGLYHQLTGETIYPTIPHKTFARSKAGENVSVSIYPNPLSDLMFVTHDNHSYQISIKDVSGRIIHSQTLEGGTSTFDTSSWHSGLYIVTLHEHDGHVSSHKVIKQ